MGKLFHTSDKPILIAGPCSVESREQISSVASQLATYKQTTMIRCGVWKPRTRPGGFEGLGEQALKWIAGLKKEHPGWKFCCEVGNPHHVELCEQYSIDAVWIGARTSVNPFLVNELAHALSNSKMPTMVKNPITPDVDLWIGAIERLQEAGVDDIAAIHRGFTTSNNLGYRNNPLWELPIEFKRRMPSVPLLCDPSHIGGSRERVGTIAQTALDLHFDGLMIECHDNPDKALTDSQQQITPQDLRSIMGSLRVPTHNTTNNKSISELRRQIDIVDDEILELLSRRMNIARTIGIIKRENNMPLFQPDRWNEVLTHQIEQGKDRGLSEDFVKAIMEKIHSQSIFEQRHDEATAKPQE